MAKVVTFFNEKGGTGKTTLTTLFASWLAYKQRKKVYVYDMDFPMYQLWSMRQQDLEYIKGHPESPISKLYLSAGIAPYSIGKTAAKESFTANELEGIAKKILEIKNKTADDDYILLDFPGRYLPNDPIYHLTKLGVIDLIVFPIDTDRQSRASAMKTFFGMRQSRKGDDPNVAALWNRESKSERDRRNKKDWYSLPTKALEQFGIPVIHGRMRDILIARRDSDTFGFIRTTMCWPELNIRKACGYIDTIFTEIKLRADGAWNNDMIQTVYGEGDKEPTGVGQE